MILTPWEHVENVWGHFFFSVVTMLLACSGLKLGIMLNILQWTAQPHSHAPMISSDWPQMSIVPRL